MMHEARWTAEVTIMNKYFPQFAAFKTENGSVGFFGRVRGPRTGREYTILIKVPAQATRRGSPRYTSIRASGSGIGRSTK